MASIEKHSKNSYRSLNLKDVSTRLGHSNSSTTLNIYAHFLRSADKRAADMMEEIFTKKPDSPFPNVFRL